MLSGTQMTHELCLELGSLDEETAHFLFRAVATDVLTPLTSPLQPAQALSTPQHQAGLPLRHTVPNPPKALKRQQSGARRPSTTRPPPSTTNPSAAGRGGRAAPATPSTQPHRLKAGGTATPAPSRLFPPKPRRERRPPRARERRPRPSPAARRAGLRERRRTSAREGERRRRREGSAAVRDGQGAQQAGRGAGRGGCPRQETEEKRREQLILSEMGGCFAVGPIVVVRPGSPCG